MPTEPESAWRTRRVRQEQLDGVLAILERDGYAVTFVTDDGGWYTLFGRRKEMPVRSSPSVHRAGRHRRPSAKS